MIHTPVLQKEVLEYLDLKPNENVVDCTIDGGGHASAILEKIKPEGNVLGIDCDSSMIHRLEGIQHLIPVCGNFVDLKEIVQEQNFGPVQGILFDLGMSSWHLEQSGRGFSFLKDEPLDMSYSAGATARDIVNTAKESEIEKILRDYGEERFSRRIAREIVKERKTSAIQTTFQLVAVIRKAIPARFYHGRIHFATRTFQALRIAVNDELNNLEKALPRSIDVLAVGGRIVVIAFHSLEDRIVKNFFRAQSPELLHNLTKKPVVPSYEERIANRRARSSKLRAAEKL